MPFDSFNDDYEGNSSLLGMLWVCLLFEQLLGDYKVVNAEKPGVPWDLQKTFHAGHFIRQSIYITFCHIFCVALLSIKSRTLLTLTCTMTIYVLSLYNRAVLAV